jgi:predicted cupin superfamily sugar epimerase
MRVAAYWIERLRLEPHPEGGYFRETYRSPEQIDPSALPDRYVGPRSVATSILFLLTGENFSALHRLRSDELWHFHDGSPLTVHVIEPGGAYRPIRLGLDAEAGASPQAVVPAGCWFGSTVDDPGGYALVGCTVAPGFDFADFELADRASVLRLYPEHAGLIERLTRAHGGSRPDEPGVS